MNKNLIRNIRKVERPRPLRLNADNNKSSIPSPTESNKKSNSEIIIELEALHLNLENSNFDENTASEISKLCSILKVKGEELETTNKDQLDRFFVTLRNLSRDDRLDAVSRMKLLEIVEMKGMRWKTNENVSNYYKSKLFELEQGICSMTLSVSSPSPSIPYLPLQAPTPIVNTVPLAPGEILRSSGKFTKPTKIIGKQYVKDEIIIRNSDSGKVMGIKGRRVHMIEELSDTVISFQRVNPGTRDRLVQITGPDEEAIGHAKNLLEDTIRRNASPVREKGDFSETNCNDPPSLTNSYSNADNQAFSKNQLSHSFSMSDASKREYTIPVSIGRDTIKLSGTKLDLLMTAQSVLSEYFIGQSELQEKQNILPPVSPNLSTNLALNDSFGRYELKKESSLKNTNFSSPYTSSWMTPQSSKISSPSPFSSSEDEYVRESADEKMPNFSSNTSTFKTLGGMKTQEITKAPAAINLQTQGMATDGAFGIREKFTRSSSVPSDVFVNKTQDVNEDGRRFSNEQMEVTIPPPVCNKIKYDRMYLLTCAKSPLSYIKPKDFDEIVRNYKEIICKSPTMFDPRTYLRRQSSPD